jgi:hypothetical protein
MTLGRPCQPGQPLEPSEPQRCPIRTGNGRRGSQRQMMAAVPAPTLIKRWQFQLAPGRRIRVVRAAHSWPASVCSITSFRRKNAGVHGGSKYPYTGGDNTLNPSAAIHAFNRPSASASCSLLRPPL